MLSKPERPTSIEREQAFMDRLNEIVDVAHAWFLRPSGEGAHPRRWGKSPPAV
jgi:hypothetical protein